MVSSPSPGVLYVYWTAPYSLLEPELVTYCIEVLVHGYLNLTCGIETTQYTVAPINDACSFISVQVIPVNEVGNGTMQEVANFTSYDSRK